MNHHFSITFIYFLLFYSTIFPQEPPQTQKDSYTRYELLEPGSHAFRIIYDVTATTPGKRVYYNTLRIGSEHSVNEVWDRMSGNKLKWEIVTGDHAVSNGHPNANPSGEYLKVYLAREVPENGGARIRIDKTYEDSDSYYNEDDKIVFERSLGIKRNSVVFLWGMKLFHVTIHHR